MKTKVNEVPLVGPRGRKELLNRINELEARIANQDYTVIEPDYANTIDVDALALATLVRQIKRNTIFNCLLLHPRPNALYLVKIVAIETRENDDGATIFFGMNNMAAQKTNQIVLNHSAETFEVFAKLQKQLNDRVSLPVFCPVDGHLGCFKEGDSIKISANGYFVSVEDDGNEKVTNLSIDYNSPVGSAESLVLDESDLQYLIGVTYY